MTLRGRSLSPTRLVKTSRFWLTDVLVAHGDKAEVLLASALTSGSEEGDCATVRGLGSLSTGVGVHFGIEDADVHVLAGCPMMTVRARLWRNTLVGAHSHLKVAMPTKATQLPSGQRSPPTTRYDESPTAHSVVETTVTDVSWAFPHIYVRSGYILGAAAIASLSTRRLKPSLATRVLSPRGHYP